MSSAPSTLFAVHTYGVLEERRIEIPDISVSVPELEGLWTELDSGTSRIMKADSRNMGTDVQ